MGYRHPLPGPSQLSPLSPPTPACHDPQPSREPASLSHTTSQQPSTVRLLPSSGNTLLTVSMTRCFLGFSSYPSDLSQTISRFNTAMQTQAPLPSLQMFLLQSSPSRELFKPKPEVALDCLLVTPMSRPSAGSGDPAFPPAHCVLAFVPLNQRQLRPKHHQSPLPEPLVSVAHVALSSHTDVF